MPLSSALFCIHLVIRHFSKTAEDRSSADTGPLEAGGAVNVRLDLVDETVWVNQSGITELFSISKQVVSYHLGNIFKEGELVRSNSIILMTAASRKDIHLPISKNLSTASVR